MTSDTSQLSPARRALLDKMLRGEAPQPTARRGVIPRRNESVAPLSLGQQQMWLLAQLMPDRPVYNECVTIHLPGPLDIAVLEQSFTEILRRHEAWRTSFPMVDGQPVQRIHAAQPMMLPLVDLRHLPSGEREGEALRLATEEAPRPFDLAQGPLLRALLVRLDDAEHRLFLTLHHIIFDGVAMYQVFLPELRAFYEAIVSGQPASLPELPIQYTDYARWQREWVQGERLAQHLDYWTAHLAGAPPTLELPTDRPRPPIQTYRGSMQPFALSARLTADLKAFSRREGVTLYMTLLAAYTALLYRYTGQEDMLIGTASGGRPRAEFQRVMGFFVNTLVLRANLGGDPTVRDLLGRMRQVTIEATAHEDVPFEYVVKAIQPQRDLRQNPLFQVLLTLEPPLPTLECGWTLTQMDVSTGTSKFDLSLELDDRPEGIIGRFEYSTELFDAETITRMIGHWQIVLEGIVCDPARRISDLPLVTAAEHHQLVVAWNDTRAAYPHDRCLPQLVEEQVARRPAAVALICEGGQLTYGELNQRANRLAHYLRAHGVGPDVLVGLCLDRCADLVVALLAILKAGGAYVPLDPAYPPTRLAFMLADAAAPVLLTQQRHLGRLPAGPHTLCLDRDAAVLAAYSAADPLPLSTPDHLAYVIYTSGSTGQPKGVEIPHRALLNLLTSMQREPGMRATDTLLAITTVSFDLAVPDFFLPLLAGARLVLASRETATSGPALAAALTHSGATIMQATPVTWRLLIEAGWPGNPRLTILCGGEALPRDLADQLLERCAGLWNMYGPTETTVWSACRQITRGRGPILIGRPIANTELYILDSHGQPVPIGVPGDLYIGGMGLARGYHNRPDLTAERFVSHPFSDAPGAKLYRTGDRARYQPDGGIEWLARLDQQVKIRGYRIELGEIEAVLAGHPAVRESVVILRDGGGDARLTAYVTPRGEAPTANELRHHLKQTLPEYMIPSAFVALPSLPLTPNGKVDRAALPAPDISSRDAEECTSAPTLTLHHQLVSVWEELLETRPIGMRDNFFDIGGHSLLAARLVERIEQVCGVKIPLTTLFASATIEDLSALLLRPDISASASSSPLVEIQPDGAKPPLFFLHGDLEGGGFYCAEMARSLGPDQPFYALQPHGVDGGPVPHTIEEMAAEYVTRLRAVRPHGPYILGGFCAAGFVAYDMARQLRQQGEAVDLLVLINMLKPHRRATVGRHVIGRCAAFVGLSAERQVATYVRLRSWDTYVNSFVRLDRMAQRAALRDVGRRMARLLAPSRHTPRAYERGALALNARREELFGRYGWAVTGYTPRPYHGRAALFWPRDEGVDDPNDPTRGWRTLLPRAEVYVTPGTHLTSITRHVQSVVDCLRASLGAEDAASPD